MRDTTTLIRWQTTCHITPKRGLLITAKSPGGDAAMIPQEEESTYSYTYSYTLITAIGPKNPICVYQYVYEYGSLPVENHSEVSYVPP